MLKIAVLVSGGGTNLQALIDACKRREIANGEIAVVISSKADAFALERAKRENIETMVLCRKDYVSSKEYDKALLETLLEYKADLVVLAGFLTIIGDLVINRFENKIINVHPSLIPSFCGPGYYGLKVHEAALKRGVKVTGATVHFVSSVCDAGPIILQKAVLVNESDTPEILQKRVMHEAEWKILPKAVSLFCEGRIKVENGQAKILANSERKGADTVQNKNLSEYLSENEYPGRGILAGKSEDGKNAVMAYFIMGRSENSRNRVFVQEGENLRTKAFDPSKMEDPSLIIYYPVRVFENKTIVTNGDQTDTVFEFLKNGSSFENALRTRTFEPDAPNFTPRVSALLTLAENDFTYQMSILKSESGNPSFPQRFFFDYTPKAGQGHIIHTYLHNGNPIPSFEGEPVPVYVNGDIDSFTESIWDSLNNENKVSLFTRFISLETGETQTRICNKNM